MELNIDFLAGATVFSTALALTIALIIVLPPPAVVEKNSGFVEIRIVDGEVVADKVVRVWVVAFNSTGGYVVYEANTPVKLPNAYFIVVFTGHKVVYTGSPPRNLKGYIYRNGFVKTEPEPPYIYVDGGERVS